MRVAVIVTAWFPQSHADVCCGKLLNGIPTDNGLASPRLQVASLYIDQSDDATNQLPVSPGDYTGKDIGRVIAKQHGVPVFKSIRQALTLGGDQLAVDGVMVIGEHGDYPYNELGQHLYPRRQFLEQVLAVLATSGRAASCPVWNDKHLSYDWEGCYWIYKKCASLGVPLIAGRFLGLWFVTAGLCVWPQSVYCIPCLGTP